MSLSTVSYNRKGVCNIYLNLQVPLGVLLLNENKIDHMCKIMDALHHYVPTVIASREGTLPNGEKFSYDEEELLEILSGGDQLTVARERSSIGIRRTDDTNKGKLKGLVPVIEDWHSRTTLAQVSVQCTCTEDTGVLLAQ